MDSTARVETLPRSTGTPYPRPSFRGRAFGLVVEAPSPVAGLASSRLGGGRLVRLELESSEELERRWRPEEAARLFRQPLPDGRPFLTLERHEAIGYRLLAHGYGSWLVSSDGASIRAAVPGGLESWLWQRFLVGQVLPFAALLQGLEVLHASGVVLGDRVVAVAGGTGAGKSSVALNLVVGGEHLFTDDVLALEPGAGPVICQPGAGAANVRDAELMRMAAAGGGPLGEIVGRGSQSLRVVLDREDRELPLGAVYFIDRRREAGEVRFEPVADPYLLLASTFNLVIRTPTRLRAQLDTCARIARSAAMFKVVSPAPTTAAELAASLADHARAALASGGR